MFGNHERDTGLEILWKQLVGFGSLLLAIGLVLF